MLERVYVGRQPIFGADLSVFGYELLFRHGEQPSAAVADGNRATFSVILNSLTEIGLETLVGSSRAFINLTRDILLNQDLSFLPADQMVLEILEDIEPDQDVLDKLQSLRSEGYCIALDDFVYHEDLEPLAQLADIVKIEFPATPSSELPRHVTRMRELGVNTILAEKLESREEFSLCLDAGCDLFQGFFFSHPQVVSSGKVHTNVMSVVNLLSELQKPDITAHDVETIVQADANLSYKLLRFINSAGTGTKVEVESIQHAASLIGLRRLRALASMMLMNSLEGDQPNELINLAVTRARMCELLAEALEHERSERYYTLGLLSVLDAMLDLPMTEVVEKLPLAEDMNQALLNHEGPLGTVLKRVIDYETGASFDTTGDMSEAYVNALKWTAECRRTTQE